MVSELPKKSGGEEISLSPPAAPSQNQDDKEGANQEGVSAKAEDIKPAPEMSESRKTVSHPEEKKLEEKKQAPMEVKTPVKAEAQEIKEAPPTEAEAKKEKKGLSKHEELLRQRIAKVNEGLEAILPSIALARNVSPRDIEEIRKLISRYAAGEHLDVFNYIRGLERELFDLRQKKRISSPAVSLVNTALKSILNVFIEKERERQEKESAAILEKPLPEVLSLIEERVNKGKNIPENLLLAALEKMKNYINSNLRALSESADKIDPNVSNILERIKNLSHFREIYHGLPPYAEGLVAALGTEAMRLVEAISLRERKEPSSALIEDSVYKSAKEELEMRRKVLGKILGEEELANFDDMAEIYRTLNRHFALDTRPAYYPQNAGRLLLEFALRIDELPAEVSAETKKDLISRANRVAAFMNSRVYLDLGQALKRSGGRLGKGAEGAFKLKTFFDVYPDIWQGRELAKEHFKALTGEFYRGLIQLYRNTQNREKAVSFIVQGGNPKLNELLKFKEDVVASLGYGRVIQALREAYGFNEKAGAEEIEALQEHLQSVRRRKILMKRGREKPKTLDQKMREAKKELEKLMLEKENLEKQSEGELPEEIKKKSDELKRKIDKIHSRIRWFERGRKTEREIKAGEFMAKRYAEIEAELSRIVGDLNPEEDIKNVMKRLYKILFAVKD
jgi:hypothetical protein